ncbi:MAG TPA: hypothetical protein VMV49_11395, partial [Candidatus Deferrimicrobium sp.]|nr:hypothetical protein [Candidatus Deferrimicrobium sp.]
AHYYNSLIISGMILNTTPMVPYGYNVLIVQFNTNGDYLDKVIWDSGETEPLLGVDLVIDNIGNVFVIGSTDGLGDPNFDILLLKFTPDYSLTPGGIPGFGLEFLLIGLFIAITIALIPRKHTIYHLTM